MKTDGWAVLLFAAALVVAAWGAMKSHRANVVLAQTTKDCAADRELVDLIGPMLQRQQ
jgi:uncharacterized membrane protein YqjE